ncbi:MAG: NAD(P)H-dependent glycerol-3-phosphate dehydrogenase [Rhodothalassiaceae bacterium]
MTDEAIVRIGILGVGAWGTALAIACHRAGRSVLLQARNRELVAEIRRSRVNGRYLPGIAIDPAIEVTNDPAALGGCDAVLLVCPAQAMRASSAALRPGLRPGTPLVICAKGIESTSGALMHEVLGETLPGHPLAVLSGPNFAAEIARGLPAAVTLAAFDEGLGARLVEAIGSASFRPYLTNDVIGVEIGGAVKNVLAIACGITVGLALGENARAALITRGLAEMSRFGMAMGARRQTLMGLSGLGDLILTCASEQSRNMSFGIALAKGRSVEEILAERVTVAEGVGSAGIVRSLARAHGVDMPIVEAVAALLEGGVDAMTLIGGLLERPFKSEET